MPIVLFLFLCNCSSGSSVITGEVRAPIHPDEVKIYLELPSQYEIIGMIEATSSGNATRQAAYDSVIQKLKVQAAKLGANGVYLQNTESRTNSMLGVQTGFNTAGIFIGAGNKTTIVQGRALYVIRE